MTREDAYYEALRTRDRRFDGKFFVGVKTTGIYCRPICPAQPKRENVEFFPNPLAAERAGYRPCLRCRPESAPRSPAWMGKSAIVQRALKMIHHQDALDFDEDRFAAKFGVSARHLRRVFREEIGKTPKQISLENRLNLARQLLVETGLPVTEVAFAAGFRSIRRFNDAFKIRFRKRPSEIRRKTPTAAAPLSVRLAYRPPFDFAGLLDFYRAHRVGRLEWFEGDRLHRVVEFDGQVGQIVIAHAPSEACLIVEMDLPDTSKIHAVIARVRAQFDLDSDPLVIANALESDPALKRVLAKHPGIRVPSGWDGFEVGVATILGQLVSVERGRCLVGDLIEKLGEPSGLVIDGQAVKLFPTAARIAASDLDGIKTTTARKRALQAFARAVADGHLSLEPTQDVEAFTKQLLLIPGIGPWTASYMALKALRHTDAFPATDLILARALERHPREVIDRLSPWRGYAAALLWREYAETLKKKSPPHQPRKGGAK
jgi:AraC family transcriptional regulator of adaptative response / DNA-3-methyladenine glycosylase II